MKTHCTHFRFKLIDANGRFYFTDSQDNALSVVHNTRAARVGAVAFVACEYSALRDGEVLLWRPISFDDLRDFPIEAIYKEDRANDGRGCLVVLLIGCAIAAGLIVTAWWNSNMI